VVTVTQNSNRKCGAGRLGGLGRIRSKRRVTQEGGGAQGACRRIILKEGEIRPFFELNNLLGRERRSNQKKGTAQEDALIGVS